VSLFNPDQARLSLGHSRILLETKTDRNSWKKIGECAYNHLVTSGNLSARLQQLLSTHLPRGRKLNVLFSDQLTRYFMVVPPKQIGSYADLKTIAELRFSTLFGDKSNDWIIQADWAADYPFLACALPREPIESIRRILDAGGWRSQGMVPESIAMWNFHAPKWSDQSAWFVRISEQHTLVATGAAGRIRQINSWIGEPPANAEQLVPILTREALRWDCPLPTTLYLSYNDVKLEWHGNRIAGVNLIVLNTDNFKLENV